MSVLAEHARAVVAEWPKLTEEQRSHLAALLRAESYTADAHRPNQTGARAA